VPPIFVINLDRDLDRLAHMRAQLEAGELAFIRAPAVNGADLPPGLLAYFDASGALRPGEIGCYASHLAIYQDMASGAVASPALILEDDVGVPPDLARLLPDLIDALPAGWDMVRLHNPSKRAFLPVGRVGDAHWLCRYSVIPSGSGATLVSRSGAQKFLGGKGVRDMPIDQDMRRAWAFGLDVYGVTPAPFAHNVLEGSTIESGPALPDRARRARKRRLRAMRFFDLPARWRMGVREFGLGPWLGAQVVNAALAGVPGPRRAAFLDGAARKLLAWRQGGAGGLDPEVPLAYPPRSRAAPDRG
jgi:glycosyl transferase family 25